MNLIKVKFLKKDKPVGRSYTYQTEDVVSVGDIVTNINGSKLIVIDEPVDMEWVEKYSIERIGVVKKYEL